MSLVGKKAPHFNTTAVANGKIIDSISLEDFTNKYVVLFFYPLDFTFVCPTELHAFQEKLEEFRSRGAEVIGCSVDSQFSHLAWVQTPKSKGGIEGVSYPLLSDLNKSIAKDYGVLKEDVGIAYRGLFLIDRSGVVRQQVIHDLPLGRSVDESLRVLDALIFHETNGDVCPANWKKGKKSMQASQEGLVNYFN